MRYEEHPWSGVFVAVSRMVTRSSYEINNNLINIDLKNCQFSSVTCAYCDGDVPKIIAKQCHDCEASFHPTHYHLHREEWPCPKKNDDVWCLWCNQYRTEDQAKEPSAFNITVSSMHIASHCNFHAQTAGLPKKSLRKKPQSLQSMNHTSNGFNRCAIHGCQNWESGIASYRGRFNVAKGLKGRKRSDHASYAMSFHCIICNEKYTCLCKIHFTKEKGKREL